MTDRTFVTLAWALSCAGAPVFSADCPLNLDRQVAAVKAFRAMAPVFQEPRCLNCHGAVNPFAEEGGHGGGYIDIRKEVEEFLQRADAREHLTTGNDPDGVFAARMLSALREISESPAPVTDNDIIRQRAFDPMREVCKQCHVDGWIIPMRDNYFTGRDSTQMCLHIKQSRITNTPGLFLRHMQEDELVVLGFKGQRGLLTAPAAQPPRMTHDAVTRRANDWIEAMGGGMPDPPECGCKLDAMVLSIRHALQDDVKSPAGRGGEAMFGGEVSFNIELKPVAPDRDDWLSGEATVVRDLAVTHATPDCKGTARETEFWDVRVRIDPERKIMTLNLGYVTDDESGSWACKKPGATDPREVQIRVGSEITDNPIEIPLGNSSRTIEIVQAGRMLTRETLTLSILR